jgi:putative transposase
MKQVNSFNRTRHSVHLLYVHLVFVSKYRRRVFTGEMIEYLRKLFSEVCLEMESTLVEMDGEHDHVHLLVSYPPKLAISVLVHRLKGRSSRNIRLDFPVVHKYYWKGVLWSPSYFASSCGGAPLEVVQQYVQQQQTPH